MADAYLPCISSSLLKDAAIDLLKNEKLSVDVVSDLIHSKDSLTPSQLDVVIQKLSQQEGFATQVKRICLIMSDNANRGALPSISSISSLLLLVDEIDEENLDILCGILVKVSNTHTNSKRLFSSLVENILCPFLLIASSGFRREQKSVIDLVSYTLHHTLFRPGILQELHQPLIEKRQKPQDRPSDFKNAPQNNTLLDVLFQKISELISVNSQVVLGVPILLSSFISSLPDSKDVQLNVTAKRRKRDGEIPVELTLYRELSLLVAGFARESLDKSLDSVHSDIFVTFSCQYLLISVLNTRRIGSVTMSLSVSKQATILAEIRDTLVELVKSWETSTDQTISSPFSQEIVDNTISILSNWWNVLEDLDHGLTESMMGDWMALLTRICTKQSKHNSQTRAVSLYALGYETSVHLYSRLRKIEAIIEGIKGALQTLLSFPLDDAVSYLETLSEIINHAGSRNAFQDAIAKCTPMVAIQHLDSIASLHYAQSLDSSSIHNDIVYSLLSQATSACHLNESNENLVSIWSIRTLNQVFFSIHFFFISFFHLLCLAFFFTYSNVTICKKKKRSENAQNIYFFYF